MAKSKVLGVASLSESGQNAGLASKRQESPEGRKLTKRRLTNGQRDKRAVAAKEKAANKRLAAKRKAEMFDVSTRKRNFRCGQTYHIFQRGNFSRRVFHTDEERAAYLNYFFDRARHYKVRVHNFCLMPNHIHFLVEQTRRHAISRLMRDLQGVHTRKQNARRNTFGNLWNQHYGCKHVHSDAYFKAVMWYVSNNPVKGCLAKEPERYMWSGAQALVSGGHCRLVVRSQKGELQSVSITLWMERFTRLCMGKDWRRVQAEPLSNDLVPMLVDIELVLDGTARAHFANQERIRRLNKLREASKSVRRSGQNGWDPKSAKQKGERKRPGEETGTKRVRDGSSSRVVGGS